MKFTFFKARNVSGIYLLSKFGLVGFGTAVIYFALMWFLDSILGLHYKIGVSIAYIVSTTFHFFANRHFTFSASEGNQGSQLMRYLMLWLVNYLLTMAVVSFCVEAIKLSPYLGVCLAVLLTTTTGFILSRNWVFKV